MWLSRVVELLYKTPRFLGEGNSYFLAPNSARFDN